MNKNYILNILNHPEVLKNSPTSHDMVWVRRDDLKAAIRWADWGGDDDSYEYDRLKAVLEEKP